MDYIGLDELLLAALREDVGTGDITTISCIPAETRSEGAFLAKESGVICGLEIAKRVFALVDSSIVFRAQVKDGDRVEKGQYFKLLYADRCRKR